MATLKKVPGQSYGARINFDHIGPGGSYEIGFGLAPSSPTPRVDPSTWLFRNFVVPPDALKGGRFIDIDGIWPRGLPNGKYVCMTFVQVPGGPKDPGGNGFLDADWDEGGFLDGGVYEQILPQDEFSNLSAVYR